MEQININDFLDFRYLGSIKISPLGTKTIFAVHQCLEQDNAYQSQLYMLKKGQVTPLTSGQKESRFIYLDDETILFDSPRNKKIQKAVEKGEEWTVFYQLSLTGGEAKEAFKIPLQINRYEKIDDDHLILQVNYDNRFSHMYDQSDKTSILKQKEEEQDYEVFNQIPYYFNNGGYTSFKQNRLFLYTLSSNHLEPLTDLSINIHSFELSPSKEELLVLYTSMSAVSSHKEALAIYHLHERTLEPLIDEGIYSLSKALYFNDFILLIGNKETTYGDNENNRFFKLNPLTKEITLFYDYPDSIGSSVGSDCRYGSNNVMKVDQNKLYFTTTKENQSHLYCLDAQANLTCVIDKEGSVDGFDCVNGHIKLIAMYEGQLQEIYTYDHHQLTQQSHINTHCLENKHVADYQEITFTNDGIEFTGWVLLPKDYDPNKKYPAILDIHGGPKTVYGKVYYHEMQVWANLGYFVFFTNPRGSDGRGNDFMDIFGRYGTIDYDDLMCFTDTVLATYPAIDTNRIGVTGGSYGGFMTNWIIGHTNRFKCAATQRSISNWISFYGTSDIGYHFAKDQIHGSIYQNIEKMWEQSPLKYINDMHTPTLFIHSDEDYRCPLEQGLQLYTALTKKGVETRFVMFKGENHELSRSGKPKHRIRRLTEITNWMEHYLK